MERVRFDEARDRVSALLAGQPAEILVWQDSGASPAG